jgi:hypothetical protein
MSLVGRFRPLKKRTYILFVGAFYPTAVVQTLLDEESTFHFDSVSIEASASSGRPA